MMSCSSGWWSRGDLIEDADRHALEQALHAERLGLPRRRRQQAVEQHLQGRINGVQGAHLALQELREHLGVAHFVDDLRAGGELGVHRRARVGELAAELHRRLLAVQELRDQVRELVPRRFLAGRLVGAHLGEDRRHEQRADARQEPLVAREGMRPVDVRLGVPLALLALLVEVAELLDLVAVLPGPLQIEGHVDVELTAQARHLLLVDELDDFELAQQTPLLGQNLFGRHRQSSLSGARGTTSP
jgi:hypothetical protein